MRTDAAFAINHRNRADIGAGVGTGQLRERCGRTAARPQQLKSAGTVRGICHRLGCHHTNTSCPPSDYSADAKIMGLDGHSELPGQGVPGDNRVGMTQWLTRNAWFVAEAHSASFTSSGETERCE